MFITVVNNNDTPCLLRLTLRYYDNCLLIMCLSCPNSLFTVNIILIIKIILFTNNLLIIVICNIPTKL